MNINRINDCTALSKEILDDFEQSRIPIENVILKCLRLCRLLGDNTGIQLFTYESSGYPCSPTGLSPDVWQIAQLAGRTYMTPNPNNPSVMLFFHIPELLCEFQSIIETNNKQLSATFDPSISIVGTPYQPMGYQNANQMVRTSASNTITSAQKWLQTIRGRLYDYILQIHNNLLYGNIVEDAFTKARVATNLKLNTLCPQAINKFVSVYENMGSDNPEDWANAVHSCRRVLMDLADTLYPAREEPIVINGKKVELGKDKYINRLMQFISSKEDSNTYAHVVGSDLSSIGNRLDAINDAVCKGTHAEITKDEASRYIIHTYLLISDIVALLD